MATLVSNLGAVPETEREEVDSIVLSDGTPILPRDPITEEQHHRLRSAAPLVHALIHKLLAPAEVRGNVDDYHHVLEVMSKWIIDNLGEY